MFIFKNKVQVLKYNYKKHFIHKERTHFNIVESTNMCT